MTDSQLVEQVLAGSEEAFRALVVRYEQRVYTLLARMLRNPSLAEELTQEAFLKAFTGLRSFDPAYKFSNWILRIAHNAAIDAMRRRGPREVSLDDPGEREESRLDTWLVDPASGNAAERLERQDVGRLLQQAVDQLRPEYRQVVVLRYQEDLSYDEIADITGWPVGTIKSHLHRARAELACCLREEGLGPADEPSTSLRPGDAGPTSGHPKGAPEPAEGARGATPGARRA